MDIKNLLTKKNIFIFAGALAVIIVAVVMIIIMFGAKPGEDLIAAVDNAWNAAKNEQQPEYLSKLDSLSSYTLTSVEEQDDSYIISASVTAPDLGGQLLKLEGSEFPTTDNADEINSFLCRQIEKSEIKTTDTFIYAYKVDDKYHITFSDEFADAMSGNLYEYSQQVFVDIMQKYEGGQIK